MLKLDTLRIVREEARAFTAFPGGGAVSYTAFDTTTGDGLGISAAFAPERAPQIQFSHLHGIDPEYTGADEGGAAVVFFYELDPEIRRCIMEQM